MPNLIQIIKQAAIEAVEAANPTRVMYGTVTSASPIDVKIDQKFTVPYDFLVITQTAQNSGLSVGDRVVLLQEQGGQKYIVIDKIGGAG